MGSRHVRDAVAAKATVPVLAIPQPVSLPDASADAPPPAGLAGRLSVPVRVRLPQRVRAQEPARDDRGVCAGVRARIRGVADRQEPQRRSRPGRRTGVCVAAVAAHPDVHLIEQRLSPAERDGLMNAADCYVSLHRAEGFGYTLAEAMWLGKPVIATGYSGNLDYMNPDNSYLVDHRLVADRPGPRAISGRRRLGRAGRRSRGSPDARGVRAPRRGVATCDAGRSRHPRESRAARRGARDGQPTGSVDGLTVVAPAASRRSWAVCRRLHGPRG